MTDVHIPHEATFGQCYIPAMAITDQAEADAYFEALVERNIGWSNSREEAERIERANLGYFAGYYDAETRERVERLFRCAHPIFGAIAEGGAPTPEEALELGIRFGEAMKREE